ncbi:glycosyltransferase family 39 protein [Mangrovimonas sp. DI 80]|uniref:ArnT family glycosyltransferase n=1 Tax=Mangrovimonas sp. DI 80 TaxID=1779330 RepID=UPI0015C56FDB|nr:glycosyltransferase family 39 protein [Mangrovimonas sp. DI 80]
MVLVLLIAIPLFWHLGKLPIILCDEARLAINAYEMVKDNNFIIPHYLGQPEMWNTKPPLLISIQSFFMKLLGANEFAFRLPSALAAFSTCVVLLTFFMKYFKDFWLGFIVILVLITSQGYVGIHASRTGDYDALLTLFTTTSGLLFFVFCETRKHKYLYLFFTFITLAVLTKGIAGLLFAPAFVIYSIFQKQFVPLLKNKHTYISILLFVSTIASYYLIREFYNPGYLIAVLENELTGRYLKVNEYNEGSIIFYFKNFVVYRFSSWYALIPFGIIVGLTINNKKINRISLFSLLMVAVFITVISLSQTKLPWYDLPMYPFLSIIVSGFIYYIFSLLRDLNWNNFLHHLKSRNRLNLSTNFNKSNWISFPKAISFSFLFLVCISPYQQIIKNIYKTEKMYRLENNNLKDYEVIHFLRNSISKEYNLDQKFILYDTHPTHYSNILFYLYNLNDIGIDISLKDWKDLSKGDVVLANQDHIKKYIDDNYKSEIIQTSGSLTEYKINDRK